MSRLSFSIDPPSSAVESEAPTPRQRFPGRVLMQVAQRRSNAEHNKSDQASRLPGQNLDSSYLLYNKQFRIILEELKEKERVRRTNLRENIGKEKEQNKYLRDFVDKDRGISHSGGARDLLSFILQRRRFFSRPSNIHGFQNFLLLKEQAEREIRRGRPEVACKFLDCAVARDGMDGLDLDIRIERGKARILLGDYKGALDDANKVLIDHRDATHPGALLVKGQALYSLANFEHALVSFTRALRQLDILHNERMQVFHGIERAEMAIFDALERRGNVFSCAGKVISSWNRKNDKLLKLTDEVICINARKPKRRGIEEKSKKKIYGKTEIDDRVDFKRDVEFMDKLMKEVDNEDIRSEVADFNSFMKSRREFWFKYGGYKRTDLYL